MMKAKTLLIGILFITVAGLNAQGLCPPNDISTDPDNPYNHQNPDVVNDGFDWLQHDYTPFFKQDFLSYAGGHGFSPIAPFWSNRPYLSWLSGFGTDGTGIDYLPEEGWELITYRLGINRNNAPDPEFYAPYFLLYNKYRGVFRLFFNIPTIDGSSVNNALITRMEFNPIETGDGVTGLFETIDGLSNPLDKKTENVSMEAYSDPAEGGWNVVEFPLAYDPCTCLQSTSIITSFRSVLNADLNMTGVSIGTSSPLALFNQNSFEDKNRLLSVLGNGVNPEIGTETYKNIEAWIDKYIAAANNTNPSELNNILTGLSELLSSLSPVTGLIGVIGSIADNYSGSDINKGIGFINKSSQYLSTQLKGSSPGGPSGAFPQVVEMEMALSGTVTASNEIQAATFAFDNPGTSPSDNNLEHGNTLHPAYPYYNEVLGTFGLLKTPVINRKADLSYTAINQIGYYEDRYTIRFDLSSLEYVFNPTLDINFDRTDIYASYVVETTADLVSSGDDMELFDNRNGVKTYISKDLLPIECLHSVAPIFQKSGSADEEVVASAKAGQFIGDELFNVHLRIMIDYEFLSLDENGNPIRTLQIFTYPVSITDNRNVSPMPCGARTSVSTIDLQAYCNDGRYKANILKSRKNTVTTQDSVATINVYVNLYPNPAREKLNITFSLPKEAIHNSIMGEIKIINSLGQQMMSFRKVEIRHGYTEAFDIHQLPAGNYYIQFVSDNFNIMKPFTKV